MSMPLQEAKRLADLAVAQLAPMADRIEIAGSIRRKRPECGDIDLVILPKPGRRRDIRERCLQRHPRLVEDGALNLIFQTDAGVQFDIYFASPPEPQLFHAKPGTWGTLLLCRTGSKQFNIWFAMKARDCHCQWNPYWGLYREGKCIASEEEPDLFKALSLAYIPPESRDPKREPQP
jgi:DNA polymerase (family 10)